MYDVKLNIVRVFCLVLFTELFSLELFSAMFFNFSSDWVRVIIYGLLVVGLVVSLSLAIFDKMERT